jgi:hypothetical protein
VKHSHFNVRVTFKEENLLKTMALGLTVIGKLKQKKEEKDSTLEFRYCKNFRCLDSDIELQAFL